MEIIESESKHSSRFTLQRLFNKIREVTLTSDKTNEDWEFPFERLIICQNDLQGCGSQGDVYYGKMSNTPVAIKRVKDKSLTQIKHLRELNHKNIIKFKGISENAIYHFIIMEWCPYGNLYDLLHKGRQISSTKLCDFAQQIASGMNYLHSKNIIHRDLKPSNILLTHNDVLKISDFESHKLVTNKQPVTSNFYPGTRAYMAPEAFRGEPHSFPVDVWSYGVVLWEIMIGDEPYKNRGSLVLDWAVGNYSLCLPIPSNFPEGFKLILNGCWKPQPNERHTFQQICMILKGASQEIDRIPKECWIPLQTSWKQEARNIIKNLQSKTDTSESQDLLQKRQALERLLEEAERKHEKEEKKREEAEKRLDKNNENFFRLQELSMHMQRERDSLRKFCEVFARKEADFAKEREIFEREKAEFAKERELFAREKEEFYRKSRGRDNFSD